MEEWLAFLETFSAYIFYKLPWKAEDKEIQAAFEEQWGNLRRGVLMAMRHRDESHTPERMREAEEHFERYARSAEMVRTASKRHARAFDVHST